MSNLTAIEEFSGADYLAILRHRKWRMGLIGLAILGAALVAAAVWPPTYRSSATILIEEPDVPDNLVRSTVSAFANERLQVIQQRVMTTQNLIGVMEKFGLYVDDRQRVPVSVIVERMRSRIGLELVSAEVMDPRSGRTVPATIAFRLWFDGRDPQIAQNVANELVTLYLSENQRKRDEQAAGTAVFLSNESNKLQDRIGQLEARLAAFKRENAGSLPEDLPINTQLLDRTQAQLLEVMRHLQALQEREAVVETQLGGTDPHVQRVIKDAAMLEPADQLRLLKSQYAAQSAKYGDQHPETLNLKRQIAALEETASEADVVALEEQVERLKAELAAASQKLGSAHPDIKRMNLELEALTRQLAEARTAQSGAAPSNPAFVQLQAQLSGIRTEIDAEKNRLQALQAKSADLEAKIARIPAVEQEYSAIRRSYDVAVAEYADVQSKGNEAELAKSLEAERMGEKLSVIEPPALPVDPARPNRPLILAFGLVFAAAGGIGLGGALDVLGGRVYGARRLMHTLGADPLVVIPYIRTKADRRRVVILALLASLMAGAAVFWAILAWDRLAAVLHGVQSLLISRLGVGW